MIKIIGRCDLCNRNTKNLTSVILHKKSFDYCSECENRAKQIKEQFKKEVEQEYLLFEGKLKRIEKIYFYNKIKRYE